MGYNSKYKGSEVEELLDSIGNKVDKVDGKQLSTEDFTTLLKQKLEGLSNYDDTEINNAVSGLQIQINTLVSGNASTAIESFNEIIAFLNGIEDSESLDSIIASIEQQIAAKYTKPSAGIPKGDLASDVQTSLSKADAALQEETYKGTVTSITAGDGLTGGTITGSGTISLESLGTAKELGVHPQSTIYTLGFPGNLNYSRSNTTFSNYAQKINIDKHGRVSSMTTQTITVARIVFDFATTEKGGFMSATDKTKLDGVDMTKKQDKLVSGTNIKTINGTSILGSGDIVIEGGGGSSSGGGGAYAEVNHGTSDTTFALTPNTFHVWEEVASLDLSFADEQAGVANEYLFQFTSGATATMLTLPDVKWANEPTIAENMIYQISVLKGLASFLEFNNKAELIENLCVGELSDSNVVFTFQHPVASDLTITFLGEMTSTVTINKGETSVIYTEQMLPIFDGIRSITPNVDDSYIYKF